MDDFLYRANLTLNKSFFLIVPGLNKFRIQCIKKRAIKSKIPKPTENASNSKLTDKLTPKSQFVCIIILFLGLSTGSEMVG